MGEEIRLYELDNREYPLGIKVAQIFVTGSTILIFFAVLYWSLQAWASFLTLFGLYKVSVHSQALACIEDPRFTFGKPTGESQILDTI